MLSEAHHMIEARVWWKHQSSGAKRHLLVQTLVCLVWLLPRVIQCIIYIAERNTTITVIVILVIIDLIVLCSHR